MASLEERHPHYEYFVGINFTDADEKGFNSICKSSLSSEHSTASKAEKAGIQKARINTCDLDSSTDLDLEFGPPDNKLIVDKSEKDCRICSINLETYSQELGVPIELGCSCNGDLAFAHRECAEKWFQIKGNMICEICGSKAKNLVGFVDANSTENSIKSCNNAAATTETQRFFHGHMLIICILGGMLLTIGICWLLGFHKR